MARESSDIEVVQASQPSALTYDDYLFIRSKHPRLRKDASKDRHRGSLRRCQNGKSREDTKIPKHQALLAPRDDDCKDVETLPKIECTDTKQTRRNQLSVNQTAPQNESSRGVGDGVKTTPLREHVDAQAAIPLALENYDDGTVSPSLSSRPLDDLVSLSLYIAPSTSISTSHAVSSQASTSSEHAALQRSPRASHTTMSRPCKEHFRSAANGTQLSSDFETAVPNRRVLCLLLEQCNVYSYVHRLILKTLLCQAKAMIRSH